MKHRSIRPCHGTSLFVAPALLLFNATSALANQPPVLGVYQAVMGSRYPQVAHLTALSRSDSGALQMAGYCSGTLIGPRAILTAAHCGRSGQRFVVMTGKAARLGTLWASPNYSRTTGALHDLAILELDRPIHGIPPWKVDFKKSPSKSEWVFFVGYGRTELFESSPGLQNLGRSRVDEVQEATFSIRYGQHRSMPLSGDSGGPVFRAQTGQDPIPQVIGLVSSGVMLEGAFPLTDHFPKLAYPPHRDFIEKTARDRKLEIEGMESAREQAAEAPASAAAACLSRAAEETINPQTAWRRCQAELQADLSIEKAGLR